MVLKCKTTFFLFKKKNAYLELIKPQWQQLILISKNKYIKYKAVLTTASGSVNG